jgi:hypothetical protein
VAAPGDVAGWVEALEDVIGAWPTFAGQAVADAGVAGERHDPARYRRQVAALVGGGE